MWEKAVDFYSSKVANILMKMNLNLFPASIFFSNAPFYFQQWVNKKKASICLLDWNAWIIQELVLY